MGQVGILSVDGAVFWGGGCSMLYTLLGCFQPGCMMAGELSVDD
jgi:hypothetical protein